MGRLVIVGIAAVAALSTLVPAAAETTVLTSGGYSFSDELGGFRLKSVSGTGTRDDPIVLIEELLDAGPAVLTIRRVAETETAANGLPVPAITATSGLTMEKIVINRTGRAWVGFELELQEVLHEPSSFHDGLSFDQLSRQTSRVGSDRFGFGERTFEPHDHLRFMQGGVDPDAAVRFDLPITDWSPVETFYLVQQPQFATAWLDTLRRTTVFSVGPDQVTPASLRRSALPVPSEARAQLPAQ